MDTFSEKDPAGMDANNGKILNSVIPFENLQSKAVKTPLNISAVHYHPAAHTVPLFQK
jgi:hypothetical protein